MGWLFGGRQKAETESLRAALKARIEDYNKLGATRAFQDRVFIGFVDDDLARGATNNEMREEVEQNKRRALEAERDGRAVMLGAAVLGEVIKQPTKAKMVALMERYVLEFGRSAAKEGPDNNFRDIFAVSMLNRILLEVKEGKIKRDGA
jgi:hypothetical protein